MNRTTTSLFAALAAALLAGPALATGVTLDAPTEARIRTQLTDTGYDVRRVDTEDGMFEVYAMKDGKKLEIYLDADLTVVKVIGAD